MAKLKSTLPFMILSLGIISLVASALLAGVFTLTKEPIEMAKKAKSDKAITDVLPDKTAQIGEEVKIEIEGMKDPFLIYPAYKNDKMIGAAIKTYSMSGYSGLIEVMVGFDAEGKIVNYSVLSMKETPGLGDKIIAWFKTEKGNQDIRGMHPEKNNLTVKKDGGEIDAITASTISSRAFLESVNVAYKAYTKYLENNN